MPIIFQMNKVLFFSDTLQSLMVHDETFEANGEPHYINGGVRSVIAMDRDRNTWIFTVPTWQHVILTPSQHVHIEGEQHLMLSATLIGSKRPSGPQIYTESGATYVCLSVCNNAGGTQAFLTRQISSKAQPVHTKLTGKVWIVNYLNLTASYWFFQELEVLKNA
jgi:hypothetical protein